MLKYFFIVAGAVLFTGNLAAQDSELRIRPSDPTLLYTQLNTSGGIDFSNYEPDHWQFSFGGTWAIKERFGFSFKAPISNIATGPSLFENISFDASYQIHKNTGLFNSSLLSIGVTTPTSEDYYLRFIRDPYSSSHEFRVNYTAGLKLSKKIRLFPQLQYFQRSGEVRVGYVDLQTGQVTYGPKLSHQGFRAGLTASYDFNDKSFLQLGMQYSQGSWAEEGGMRQLWGVSDNTIQSFDLRLRYQYALRPQSQIFLEIHQQFDSVNSSNRNWNRKGNYAGFNIGYTYFLD